MSPVHLVRFDDVSGPPSRVPVVTMPFWVGRDPSCDLCVWDLRVSRRHAKLRKVRGEHLLSAEGTNPLFVNGNRVALLALRTGDEVALTGPEGGAPVRLRFENALQDVFVPEGASVTEIASGRPNVARLEPGRLGRYDLGEPLDPAGLSAVRAAVDRESGRPVALKVLGPVTPGPEGDRFLRLATALGGATHPSLARVVEAGIAQDAGRSVRWLAMDVVRGRSAAARIAEGAQSLVTVLRRLRGLAGALGLLHRRGVVHGDVTPANVLLRADGGATLVDFARAFLVREGTPAAVPLSADPGYVAPEASRLGGTAALSAASDVYGLAAAGFGMATGRHPRALPRGSRDALPFELPDRIVDAWRRALSEDPAERPTADELEEAFTVRDGRARVS